MVDNISDYKIIKYIFFRVLKRIISSYNIEWKTGSLLEVSKDWNYRIILEDYF